MKTNFFKTLIIGIFFILISACNSDDNTGILENELTTNELLPSDDFIQQTIAEARASLKKEVKDNTTRLRIGDDGKQFYAGYYRLYGQDSDLTNLENVPSDIDMVILFGWGKPWGFTNYEYPPEFKLRLKNEIIPNLQSRGIKVVVTGEIEIPQGVSHDQVGYAHTARRIMNELIYEYNFDGFDVDIEYIPSGQHLEDLVGVYNELAKYMGKSSGTDKLLVYDTNLDTDPFFRRIYNKVDFVFFQIYGRATESSLQSTWNAFSPYINSNQFIPGFSFYEERGYPGNSWRDIIYPRNGTGRGYDMAHWNPSGGLKKGGVFGYAIGRDGDLRTQYDDSFIVADYKVSKEIKAILTEQDGGDVVTPPIENVKGVVYYEHINKLGVATKKLPMGFYPTLSSSQSYGFRPYWASSVSIPERWYIVAFRQENYEGNYILLYNGGSNNLLDFTKFNANDQIKSFYILDY